MLNSPFLHAGRSISNTLVKTPKISFNGLIVNLEKTVSTINQVIPLYNQVKPLITDSKNLLKGVGKYFKRSNTSKNNINNATTTNNTNNVIDVEIKKEDKKKEEVISNINNTSPYKPFFI